MFLFFYTDSLLSLIRGNKVQREKQPSIYSSQPIQFVDRYRDLPLFWSLAASSHAYHTEKKTEKLGKKNGEKKRDNEETGGEWWSDSILDTWTRRDDFGSHWSWGHSHIPQEFTTFQCLENLWMARFSYLADLFYAWRAIPRFLKRGGSFKKVTGE